MNLPFAAFGSRAAALGLLVFINTGGVAVADQLEDLQKASETWIQTRLEAARTESDWVGEREMLTSTLAGYRDRAAVEEEKRDFTKAKTAKDREELDALRAKARDAKSDLEASALALKRLAEKLEALRPKLPPHLARGLEFAYRSLRDPNGTPAEHMQFAIAIVTRCAQFDRAITRAEEIVTVDGKAKALEAIYWGLSEGYALDRKTGQAWLGRPVGPQWSWEPLPAAAERVSRLLAIYDGKADPEFVFVSGRLGAAQPVAAAATTR